MSSTKIKKRKRDISRKDTHLIYLNYEITFDSLEDQTIKKLPQNIHEQFEDLYDLTLNNPKKAIPQLLSQINNYQNIPVLYNWLFSAYLQVKDIDNAESIATKNYKNNPHYIFSKLNYAQICILKGDFKKIPDIFKHKFELKLLYPKRKRFHISEFVGFAVIMSMYFNATEQRKTAELWYNALQGIAPKHPATKQVKKTLYPSLFQRLLMRIRIMEKDGGE